VNKSGFALKIRLNPKFYFLKKLASLGLLAPLWRFWIESLAVAQFTRRGGHPLQPD
jgi:hypothetical protein